MPTPSTQERVPAGLKEAVDKFMAILEKGQPDALFGLVSSEGVVFGIESDPLPVSRIRDELRKKEGIYCLLFDTDCLRKETLQEWKRGNYSGNIEAAISLREAISSASEKKININGSGKQGWVSWKLELNGKPGAGFINATDFDFALEKNAWVLKRVAYPGYR